MGPMRIPKLTFGLTKHIGVLNKLDERTTSSCNVHRNDEHDWQRKPGEDDLATIVLQYTRLLPAWVVTM